MSTPTLRTERLVLRAWREEDKVPFAVLNGDAEVMEFFPSTLTREQSDQMVDVLAAAWERRGYGLWAVERIDTGSFIGFVGLSSPTWHADPLTGDAEITPCVEVGWRLSRAQWGHGFAPEAALTALGFALDHVELPRDEVVSFTTVANERSRRVMEKIGLRRDPARDFDHPMTPGWVGQRHVLYAASRAELAAARAARVAR